MDVKIDNPAGRLYQIVSSARLQDRSLRVREVWGRVFDISPDDDIELLNRLGQLLQLLADAKEKTESLATNKELFLKPFPALCRTLSVGQLDATWQPLVGHLKEETMVGLAHCSELLSEHCAEPVLDEGQLSELQSQVSGLIERILAGDLRRDLKTVLLDQLEALRKSIVEYRIRGIVGLKSALEQSLGNVIWNAELHGPGEQPEDVGSFFRLLRGLMSLVGFQPTMKRLPGPLQFLLPREPE